MRLALVVLVPLFLAGCASRIDRFLVERPIAEALRRPDVDQACRGGNAQTPVAAGLFEKKPAHRALALLETTAAACAEAEAMEAELRAERALFFDEGEERVARVKEAREVERRHRAVAAARLWRAWGHVEAEYGPIGEGDCPRLKRRADELTWLLGLVAGANALLQDQASGGGLGVPQDVLGKVARAADCVDAARWWYAPDALQAGSWAMVPGSGPDGVDPWEALDEAAAAGDATGVRVARSIQVQLAANAGKDDTVDGAVRAFAAAASAEGDPDFALIDAYAAMVVRHQADLSWTRARGYRATVLGELPGDAADAPAGPDPFAEDPFGGDPFGGEPTGGDPFAEGPALDAPDTDPPQETP